MEAIETHLNYRKPLIPLNLDDVNYIIIHHPKWRIASPHTIHEDVLADPEKKDWNGFPYNEYVRKNGNVYIGRGDNIGSQCQGYNSISYGICCEGDYDVETEMPEVQKQALIERIRFNKPRFPNYQLTAPHSQFCETECPGKYFPMVEILKRIEVINVNFDEAVKILVENKVITNEAYWRCAADCVIFLKDLMINFAKKIVELKK